MEVEQIFVDFRLQSDVEGGGMQGLSSQKWHSQPEDDLATAVTKIIIKVVMKTNRGALVRAQRAASALPQCVRSGQPLNCGRGEGTSAGR